MEEIEYSGLRTPKDVIRQASVLAKLEGKTLQEWANTTLRAWIHEQYEERIKPSAVKS